MVDSPYPDYIPLRTIVWGGAAKLETTAPLRVEARTVGSRSLMWGETGWRFEAVGESRTAPNGVEAVIEVPPTDLTGWIDPVSLIPVTGLTHTYTTTLSVFDGPLQVAQYVIGPYEVPTGATALDGDLLFPVTTPVTPGAWIWFGPNPPSDPAAYVGWYKTNALPGEPNYFEWE